MKQFWVRTGPLLSARVERPGILEPECQALDAVWEVALNEATQAYAIERSHHLQQADQATAQAAAALEEAEQARARFGDQERQISLLTDQVQRLSEQLNRAQLQSDDLQAEMRELMSQQEQQGQQHRKAADKKGANDKPAYIFIDELDRCRPTFAIELLERIKHLFDIEGCKFIIASDTVQLAHSITAIYGHGFESHKYLKRFFDAEFTLDNSNMDNWVRTCYQNTPKNAHESINLPMVSAVRNQYPSASGRMADVDSDTIALNNRNNFNPRQAVLSALEKTFSPKLRELEKLVSQISAFEKNCNPQTFQFFFAAYLLFLKDADRNLYRELIRARGPLAESAVEARFPGYKLYFGDSNVNVHSLADVYFKCLRTTPGEVSRWMQRDNGSEYVGSIYAHFVNHFEELASYPSLVDLAHRLD